MTTSAPKRVTLQRKPDWRPAGAAVNGQGDIAGPASDRLGRPAEGLLRQPASQGAGAAPSCSANAGLGLCSPHTGGVPLPGAVAEFTGPGVVTLPVGGLEQAHHAGVDEGGVQALGGVKGLVCDVPGLLGSAFVQVGCGQSDQVQGLDPLIAWSA
jgi:hypothetical protein